MSAGGEGGRWPGGARCAVAITVQLDAELLWLRLDPSVERRPKTASIGTYGLRRGARRVLDALDAAGAPSSWFVPAAVARRERELVGEIAVRGHELACRGDGLELLHELDGTAQRTLIERAAAELEALGGARPRGFRGFGDLGEESADVLAELGFAWSSCLRGTDLPTRLEGRGGPTAVVDLPRHWELEDAPFFLFNYAPAYPTGQSRIASYARVLEDWKLQFDAYRDEGLCFVLTLDPQAIGTPGRIALLEELLAHVVAAGDAWLATGAEIAAWWRGRPTAGAGPAAPAAQAAPAAPSAEAIRRRLRRDGW